MAEFTVDHQAWFRLWLPLGASVPTDDTYRPKPPCRPPSCCGTGPACSACGSWPWAQEPCEAKRHEITAIPRLLARVILVLA